MTPTQFGDSIRQRRQSRGLTLADAAAKAGMSRPAWSRIEAGGISVGIETAQRIADALGVKLSRLIAEAEKV